MYNIGITDTYTCSFKCNNLSFDMGNPHCSKIIRKSSYYACTKC